MANAANAPKLKPWGRFKLVSKEGTEESDHIYFTHKVHKIGRNRGKVDILLDLLFISGIHCIISLEGKNDKDEPVVKLQDLSRNGVYVNEKIVGKSKSAVLTNNITIHFTKPGLNTKGVPPTVYKFELLKEGLTPENEKLRENSVAQLNMTPVKTLTSTGSSNNSGVAFSTNTSPGILDASTKLKKRPHDTNIEEVQLNTSLTTPLEGEQSSGKKKSRRETSHPSVAPPPDEDLLQVSSTLQRANMNLRDKLKEAAEKESKLKEDLCTSEKNRAALTKQLSQTTKETQEWKSKYEAQVKLVQNSKEQMESINRDLAEMQNTLQKMNQDFDLQTKNIQAHLKTIEQLKAEKMTVQEENSMMRARMDQHKTRVEKLEDKIRILEAEKKNLIIALDSVKLRSEVVEEGKRGMDEENTVLKSRLKSAHQVFRQLEATMKHLSHRLMIESSLPDSMSSLEEENTMMMIHGPAGAGSIPSEPSQATQDDFCADTQPDDGFGATEMEVEHAPNLSIVHEDEEETAPMTEGREGTEVVIDKRVEDQGERENEEEELIVVDKNDFQKEEVVEEEVTAGNLDETFQNTSAIMQSNEDTLLATPESSTQTTQKVESESPLSVNDAENGALTKEVQKNQIEDVVIVDNVDEEDKENTVKSVKVDKKNCTVPAISTTPTMRKRWLQVLNDDENNDEPSNASENGCIFDDETQLSEDVANILNTAS